MRDRTGLQVIDRDYCLHLLGTTLPHVGRVGVVDGEGTPLVLPVNYRLDGEAVVFRIAEGGALDAALPGGLVAFEVDAVDTAWQEGWSVLVHGTPENITDTAEQARLTRVGLHPWAPGQRVRWVRLPIERVSGRAII